MPRTPSSSTPTRPTPVQCCTALVFAVAAGVTGAGDVAAQGFSNDASPTPGSIRAAETWDNKVENGTTSVLEHDRQPYLPDGIRYRTFLAYPEIATTTTFDDNVFASPSTRRSDFRIDVSPSIQITNDMPRHQLKFGFGGRMARYLETSSLDHEDAFANLEGALHINHAHTVFAKLSTNYSHADNFQINNGNVIAGLTPIWTNRALIGIVRDNGRLHGSLTASAERYDFHDVEQPGGADLNQDHRDTTFYTTTLTTKYRFSPGYTGIMRGRYVRQQTKADATPDGNLDSNGYDIMAGISAEISPVLTTTLLGGYAYRTYDRNDLDTSSSATVEASLRWLPTQLLTVTATARHGLNETPLQNDFGIVDTIPSTQTSLSLAANYEILRNLVLNLNGEYRLLDSLAIDHTDQRYIARVGLDYYHTKNWLFQIGYEHQLRQSDSFPDDIARNRIWATAKLRF